MPTEEEHREPWECLRTGDNTPIESAMCTKCERSVDRILGEEVYGAEHAGEGYRITMPDARNDQELVVCECGSDVFDIEFASVCSYCAHVASKDD